MNNLRELLAENTFVIPPLIVRKIGDAIDIFESNVNEAQVEGAMRILIQSLARRELSVVECIQAYLDSPETLMSATRQIFDDVNDWVPPRSQILLENIEDNEDNELEEGENHDNVVDPNAVNRRRQVDDFLNMFPRRQ